MSQLRRTLPLFLFVSVIAAAADSTSFFGVQTHFGQFTRPDMTQQDMEAQLDLIVAAGFTAIRDECYWADVEKQRGVFTFPPQADAYITAALARGLEVLLILDYNNPLYAPHAGSQMVTDSNRAAFVRYCEAVVQRYRPMGVKQYELWNEPNLPMFWDPAPNAAEYVKLLKAAYPAIKRIAPDAIVLGCATSPLEGQPAPNIPWTTFIASVARDSGLKYMDALSFHQYRVDKIPEAWLANDLLTAKNLTNNTLPLWITEVGYHTSSAWPYTTQNMQADMLARMTLLGRTDPMLKRISYYDLKNDGTEPSNPEHNFGILLYDRTPKPAYHAMKTLQNLIASRGIGTLNVTAGNYTVTFGTPGARVVACWNPTAAAERQVNTGAASWYRIERDGARTLFLSADTVATVTYASSPKYLLPVAGTPSLRSLRIQPRRIAIDSTQSLTFVLSGEDSAGNPAVVANTRAVWSVIDGSGTVSASGKLVPGMSGTVAVRVQLGAVSDTAVVSVYRPAGLRGMNDFEQPSEWKLAVMNLDSAGTFFGLSNERSSSGLSSGRLDYRFTHKSGNTASSYRALLTTETAVPGDPDSVMIDVFGNGGMHRLEFRFRDLYGETFSRTAADQPVTWNGVWRPVRLWMKGFGANVDLPLTLDRITVYTVPAVLQAESTYTGTIYLDNLRARFTSVASVSGERGIVQNYRLEQNYPNPFNPSTTIAYTLPVRSRVMLTVYTVLGQRIARLVSGVEDAGVKSVVWNDPVPSGIYLCRLEAVPADGSARWSAVTRMVAVK